MDRIIERLSRGLGQEPASRRGFIGLVGRATAGTGLAVLGLSATEQTAEAYIDCWDGEPLLDFDWFDGFDAGWGWSDLGDFGYPIFDPIDLPIGAQGRVNNCVRRCVGGATGVEGYLRRLECEQQCTQAEINRIQRQQQLRRLRRRRRPNRPSPRSLIRCL